MPSLTASVDMADGPAIANLTVVNDSNRIPQKKTRVAAGKAIAEHATVKIKSSQKKTYLL